MTHHARGVRRGYRKRTTRQVEVYTDVNRVGRSEQVAKIITTAGLEQARLEATAQADARHASEQRAILSDASGRKEVGHA
jgi:hypothetical protein